MHPRFSFSLTEQIDLFKAWVAISLTVAILQAKWGFLNPEILLVAGITVGIGFLLHELAHKYVAQYYRLWAEFRADETMLALALGMAFFGFAFIAPGAVMIAGAASRRQIGHIAAAGPITNIVLALLCLLLAGSLPLSPFMHLILMRSAAVNSWLAFFNLIPIGPLDGVKIMGWNQGVWLMLLAVAGFLTFGL